MKTFTPIIYQIANPIGFDKEVYLIQQQLAKISWLQAIFGVAHVQERYLSEAESEFNKSVGLRGTARYSVYYPQGRKYGQATTDAIDEDLSFNDSYASRIFFLVEKANINPKVDPWNWVQLSKTIEQKFSIILHCNQQSLQITSYEQLKNDILYALNFCPHIIGVELSENRDDVWKEFTIPDTTGVTRHPNYCLRLDCICTYLNEPYNGASGYYPATEVNPRSVIGWRVGQIVVEIVSSSPTGNQVLTNGDVIPLQYVLNGDGTVTVPYLNSVYGISVLSRFMYESAYWQGTFFVNGKLTLNPHGTFKVGKTINFDASLPIWSE